jgi:hypothetical protein
MKMICLFLALWTASTVAAKERGFSGNWIARLDRHVFIALKIDANTDAVSGTLSMPSTFNVEPGGLNFSNVRLPIRTDKIRHPKLERDSLSFQTTDPTGSITDWTMTRTGPDTASLQIRGIDVAPLPLVRSAPASVSRAWDPRHSYSILDSDQSSAEMNRIFDEDQAERGPAHWNNRIEQTLSIADTHRRSETLDLVKNGRLRSADDFTKAAFIFQHGSTREDFLLAHTLALAALARGNRGASWIAAASLDAYLQASGQRQIYGTRFHISHGQPELTAPFDTQLIPESLRLQLGVPSVVTGKAQYQRAVGPHE